MKRKAFGVTQVALVFLAVMVGLAMAGGAAGLLLQRSLAAFQPPPAATAAQARAQIPPEPRLQVDPLADRQVVHGPEARASTYGWADKARGRARIPVDAAMRVLAERGWPQPEPGR